MSRVISKESIQMLMNKIQAYELQYYLSARKLDYLKNQLDIAHLCYKRDLVGLTDSELKEFADLEEKVKNYEEVEIK